MGETGLRNESARKKGLRVNGVGINLRAMSLPWKTGLAVALVLVGASVGNGATANRDNQDIPGSMVGQTSVRESGMGGGGVVVEGEVAAAASSPAGLAQLPGAQAYYGHEFGLSDSWFDTIGYGVPMASGGFLSGNLNVLSSRNFVETDDSGSAVRRWNNNDFGLTVTYASRANAALSAGINIKMFAASLYGTRWLGVAFDAGVQSSLPAGLRAGVGIANIGWEAAMGAGYRIAPNLAVGFEEAREIGAVGFDAKIEMRQGFQVGDSPLLFVGGEATLYRAVSVRFGWRPMSAAGALSTGVGVVAGSLTFDYAYLPLINLGTLHRLGVTMSFLPRRPSGAQS